MARIRKPLIEAEAFETKKLSFEIPVELETLILQYAEFASAMQGQKITSSGVVTGALRKIETDQMFKEWLNEKRRKEVRHGAETRTAATK